MSYKDLAKKFPDLTVVSSLVDSIRVSLPGSTFRLDVYETLGGKEASNAGKYNVLINRRVPAFFPMLASASGKYDPEHTGVWIAIDADRFYSDDKEEAVQAAIEFVVDKTENGVKLV